MKSGSVPARSFREHRVDLIEQRARAALLHERDEPGRWILFRIDRERRLQQLLELRAILRRDIDAGGERDVRSWRLAVLQFDRAREVLARAGGRSAQRLRKAVERDEHLVERPL